MSPEGLLAASHDEHELPQFVGGAAFAAPGTFTLALVFLAAFVLYYFINWKYLAQVWGLS